MPDPDKPGDPAPETPGTPPVQRRDAQGSGARSAGAGSGPPGGGDGASGMRGGGAARFWRGWGRRGLVVGAVAVAVIVAGVVAAVALGGDGLPAPRPLAHDPVPAERNRTTVPADCGVTGETLKALTPRPQIDRAGDGGKCEWSSDATEKHGDRRLTVTVSLLHAGPGVPNATATAYSSEATAMNAFVATVRQRPEGRRPVTGLGDEAVVAAGLFGRDNARRVTFRTGNLIATAEYEAEPTTTELKQAPLSTAGIRDGAFRAAADIARRLGAPAEPALGEPRAKATPVKLQESACALVPGDLRERLVGADVDGDVGKTDPLDAPEPGTEPATRGCQWLGDARELTVAITSPAAAGATSFTRDTRREYLRRYLEARAEPPISSRDARYFHALSGLGDQAFCAYLAESELSDISARSPARIVARVGEALVTVTYGTIADDESEPLTEEEAVNGAYAAAVHVVRAVRS